MLIIWSKVRRLIHNFSTKKRGKNVDKVYCLIWTSSFFLVVHTLFFFVMPKHGSKSFRITTVWQHIFQYKQEKICTVVFVWRRVWALVTRRQVITKTLDEGELEPWWLITMSVQRRRVKESLSLGRSWPRWLA